MGRPSLTLGQKCAHKFWNGAHKFHFGAKMCAHFPINVLIGGNRYSDKFQLLIFGNVLVGSRKGLSECAFQRRRNAFEIKNAFILASYSKTIEPRHHLCRAIIINQKCTHCTTRELRKYGNNSTPASMCWVGLPEVYMYATHHTHSLATLYLSDHDKKGLVFFKQAEQRKVAILRGNTATMEKNEALTLFGRGLSKWLQGWRKSRRRGSGKCMVCRLQQSVIFPEMSVCLSVACVIKQNVL